MLAVEDSPSENVNITDKYRHLLECEYNQLAFLSTSREMYAVYTGSARHAIRCKVDNYTSYAFIISSTKEDAIMGKLYVLNTDKFAVTNFWIATQEIKEVGDTVTAVGVDPSTGYILIAAKSEFRKRGFDLILLKPLRKDVTSVDGFVEAVDTAKENLKNLFTTESKRRRDKLLNEIAQIRREITKKQIPNPFIKINTSIVCEFHQLQELINTTGNEIIKLFDENIRDNEAQEQRVREIQCINSMNKLRVKISDFRKTVKSKFNSILPTSLGSSVDIGEDTCLEILQNINHSFSCSPTEKMFYKQLKYHEYDIVVQNADEFLMTNASASTGLEPPTIVTILGKNHVMGEAKTYFGEAPSLMQYQSFLSSLELFINGQGFDIGRDFSTMLPAPWFKPSSQESFTDKAGNTLKCKDGRGVFSIEKKALSYPVFPYPKTSIVQCHGDYENSRAFIIVSTSRTSKKGKLYVFDTKNYVLKNNVNVREIMDVGDNITAVTVRPVTGEVIISEKVIALETNGFTLKLLKPTVKQEEEANKPHPSGIQEFTLILKQLEDNLIDRYDKDWKNCYKELIGQYYLLKIKINPLEEETRNVSAMDDAFNDSLKEAVTSSMGRITEIYHYNLARLDEKISKERKICRSELNTFQTKMIRDIENVFTKYNSETDGTHTELWPEEFSKTTCTKTLSGIHPSYTCARTDELREEKRYLLEIEKFLKNFKSVIINID